MEDKNVCFCKKCGGIKSPKIYKNRETRSSTQKKIYFNNMKMFPEYFNDKIYRKFDTLKTTKEFELFRLSHIRINKLGWKPMFFTEKTIEIGKKNEFGILIIIPVFLYEEGVKHLIGLFKMLKITLKFLFKSVSFNKFPKNNNEYIILKIGFLVQVNTKILNKISENERLCKHCSKYMYCYSVCKKCRITYYCSKKCQIIDWEKHKKVCGVPIWKIRTCACCFFGAKCKTCSLCKSVWYC